MNKLKEYFNNLLMSDLFYFTILGLIIVYLIGVDISNKRKMDEKYHQNVKALQDSIVILKKNIYTKTSFVTELQELKELNKHLYDSIIKIQKQLKGNIINYISYKQEINYDSIKLILKQNNINKLNDSIYVFNSKFDTVAGDLSNGFKLSGKTFNKFNIKNNSFYGNIQIDTLSIFSSFKVGTYYDKATKLQKVFIQPTNPNIKITGIEGVNLKPTYNKKFSIGIGIGTGFGYTNKIVYTPFVGIYVGYNLINF